MRLSPAVGLDVQNDATLCRFLRARNYNVDEALAMLNTCLAQYVGTRPLFAYLPVMALLFVCLFVCCCFFCFFVCLFVFCFLFCPFFSLLLPLPLSTMPTSRATWSVDTMLEEPDPLEPMWQDAVPISFCGHDRAGRPILIERTGTVQIPQMMRHISREDFFYRHLRHMELVERQIAAASRLFGSHVSQVRFPASLLLGVTVFQKKGRRYIS